MLKISQYHEYDILSQYIAGNENGTNDISHKIISLCIDLL